MRFANAVFPSSSFASSCYHLAPWRFGALVLCWAPVSEPGFLDFQISRLLILEILSFCEIILKNMVVRYRGINNKGVLDWGPFLVHWNFSLPEIMKMKRFDYLVRQNIGDLGSIKLRKVFPLISVLPSLNCNMGSTKQLFYVPLFFPGSLTGA